MRDFKGAGGFTLVELIVTFDGSDAVQTAEAYEQYMADNSERLIYYVDAVYEDGLVTGVKAPR